jgi:hypothetical protein
LVHARDLRANTLPHQIKGLGKPLVAFLKTVIVVLRIAEVQ